MPASPPGTPFSEGKKKITRQEINDLPLQNYTGKIILVREVHELEPALCELRQEKILGFDTETRPSFRKNETYLPALIQLAGKQAVYLFQLKQLTFHPDLRAILEDEKTTKAGVQTGKDLLDLQKLANFEPAGFCDLAKLSKETGLENHGLRGLTSLLLGFRISKTTRKSNWARQELTEKQIRYAATDAWVGRELYLIMKDLPKQPNLDKTTHEKRAAEDHSETKA